MLKKLISISFVELIFIIVVSIVYIFYIKKAELDPVDTLIFGLITLGLGTVLILILIKQFPFIDAHLRIIKILGTATTIALILYLNYKFNSYNYTYRIYIHNKTNHELKGCEIIYNKIKKPIDVIFPKQIKLIKINFGQDNVGQIVIKYSLNDVDTLEIPASTESGFRFDKIIK